VTFGVDATSHGAAEVGGDGVITWSHTCGASANKLVVQIGAGDATLTNRAAESVAYNGVALANLGASDDGSFERAEIWRLNSPGTGSALNIVVTATSPGAPGQLACGAVSFNDADAAEGAASTNTGTSADPTVTVADSANGDIVVSILATDLGAGGDTTENGTLIWEDEDVAGDSDFNAQRQVATGANTVCGWTSGANGWATMGVAVKPTAGSAPGANAPTQRSRGFNLQQMADAEDEGRFNELDVRNWWRMGLMPA